MSAYIQRPDGSALYFDLTEEERHGGTADVTKYPVEEGPDITDHVRPEPSPFNMRCFITNTPLEPSGNQIRTLPGVTTANVVGDVVVDATPFKPSPSLAASVASAIVNPIGAITDAISGNPGKKLVTMTVLRFPNEFNAPEEALFALKDIQDKSELLTVFTSLAEYTNMVLQRYEIVRTYETGTGAEVELYFVPLTIVKVATAATPITTEPAAKNIKKVGKKDPQPDVPRKSIAANGVDEGAKLFGGGP